MKITNNSNLPEVFVQFAESDYRYKDKQYSVTSIIGGLKETILKRRHQNEIEMDVADMNNMILGQAVHLILEKADKKDYEIKEKYVKENIIGDYKLSGYLDLYNFLTKTVYDYKTSSVWKVKFEDYDDYKKQLLMYAWLLRQKGYEVEAGEIVLLIKDWSKTKSQRDADYPNQPIIKINFQFDAGDFEYIENWIYERFKFIKGYETLTDDQIPYCRKEERWADDDSWAVYKKGNKKAYRVLDTEEEAKKWMENNKGNHIEYREGTDTKCLHYCNVTEFCDYYRNNYKEG